MMEKKEVVKKKRGSKQASIEVNNTASKTEIAQIIKNGLYWFNREIVKSDEECAERLNEFFNRMAETGEIPTVEKMCLALGTVRQTVWDWEERKTKGQVRSDLIKKAKELLASMDAELVSTGKIPQITYIFRAKNFFGMKDQQDFVLTPNNPLGNIENEQEIRKRLTDGTIEV